MNIRNILKAAGLAAAVLLASPVLPSCQEKVNAPATEYTIEPVRKEFIFSFRSESKKSMVQTNAPIWMVQSNYSWILAEIVESDSDGKIVQITVDENESGEKRSGSFDLIAVDEAGHELARKSVEVVQNPKSGVVDGAVLFEDEEFENYIITSFDRDGDGILSLEEAEDIIEIDIENMGIKSVEGVRYFKNLETLDVNENNLKQLDLSGLENLKYVYFNMNKVSSFKVEGCSKLQSVMGRSNNLTKVDFSGQKKSLQVLDLMQNRLTELDLSGMSLLEYVALGKNSITSLNTAGCASLAIFSCNENNISTLELKDSKSLLTLDCSSNYITELNLTANVKLGELKVNGNTTMNALDLSKCPIINLNISKTGINSLKLKDPSIVMTLRLSESSCKALDLTAFKALEILDCSGIQFDTPLNVSDNLKLKELICANSNLTSLDLLKQVDLQVIDVQNNTIGALDLGNAAKLTEVNVKGNRNMELILPKSLESSQTLKIFKDGDCIQTYR